MPVDLISILNTFIPTNAEVFQTLTSFNKLSPNMQSILLGYLDPAALEKLARWAQTFSADINSIGVPVDIEPASEELSGRRDEETDFFKVMNGTQFTGKKLSEHDLVVANKTITEAIKAQNWTQAIAAGMSLASMIPA